MLHITQCILDDLLICKCVIGYFAGDPRKNFFRIFTAMMNIVAYAENGRAQLFKISDVVC